MFSRLLLASGVAALAISVPVAAKPERGGGGADRAAHGNHGGGGGQGAQRARGGGGDMTRQRAERPQMQRMERRSAQRVERPQMQRVERQAMQRVERRERPQMQRVERQAMQRVERRERPQMARADRAPKAERQLRQQRVESRRFANSENRRVERMQMGKANADRALRVRNDRVEIRNRDLDRVRVADIPNRGFGVGGCPPGLMDKGCAPPGLTKNTLRVDRDAFRESRLASLAWAPQTRFIDPVQAFGYVGSPLSNLSNAMRLAALPSTMSYLYPDTDDYYYRYGGGYVYRVERDNDLVNWALPLLAGGFLPGQYLPTSYMNSYVPDYYGFNNFYPDSPYECNRYANGVVYQVDCASGLVEDVIPLYAGGYGVGQMLPSSYAYYNVPSQYRSMYYNTSDANYWYAPGAIYQYDPSSSLITSIAALLSPGFTIGQQLPTGYGMYNVPMSYRDTYYDTPNAWYRYNNGNIYQVDPTTMLVTAVVASILS